MRHLVCRSPLSETAQALPPQPMLVLLLSQLALQRLPPLLMPLMLLLLRPSQECHTFGL